MKEKLANLATVLQKKLDQVFIVMLGVIVLILLGLYFNEQSSITTGGVLITAKQPAIVLRDEVDSKPNDKTADAFFAFKAMADPEVAFDDENDPYRVLGEVNMFDAKTVRSEQELTEDAKKFLLEARNLKTKGEINKALKMLDKALLYKPDLDAAQALRDQIKSEMTAVTPTPTPAENAGGDGAWSEGPVAGQN